MQWVGKAHAAEGRGAATHRLHILGSGRLETGQFFRKGSSLRKESFGSFPRQSPDSTTFCISPSQESLQTLFIICWPVMQPSWVYCSFPCWFVSLRVQYICTTRNGIFNITAMKPCQTSLFGRTLISDLKCPSYKASDGLQSQGLVNYGPRLASWLCKCSLISTQSCPLFYKLSKAVSCWNNRVVAPKTIWPTKRKIFALRALNMQTSVLFQSLRSRGGKTEVQRGSENWPKLERHLVRNRASHMRTGHPSVIWLFAQQVFS